MAEDGSANRTAGPANVGLALAGGGPEGAVYEIGALRAIDEAVEGLDLNAMHTYVGVSAGAFLASCLANGLTPRQLVRSVVSSGPDGHPFVAQTFFTPAVGEFAARGLSTPRLAFDAVRDYLRNPEDVGLFDSLTRVARALPTGLFGNDPIRRYLARIFSMPGRTDDFRELDRNLIVVATDLDSGQETRFGLPPHDDVPISRAVQASTALPGLYPPVEIDGRSYVDGVLLKTLHASVALDAGCGLLLCINPIVPVDTADAVDAGVMREGRLARRGLPTILSQTFRTLVHSRLAVGMSAYSPRYPDADVVLLEPSRDDYRMFFTNIFRFSSRKSVVEHAYASTRRQLLDRADEIGPILARHGLRLRTEVLHEDRDLWASVGLAGGPRPGPGVTGELDRTLARLDAILQAR